ncbi:MAG: 50S ribosomal protein L11 methyltransferase [Methylomicrobium sp.]
MTWHQLSVITDEPTAPELSDFFSELGAVSVTYMDAEDQPVYEPLPGETKIWPHTKVIALYELDADPAGIQQRVFDRFAQHPLTAWQAEILEDQAWERAWMDYYQPMKFANRLWVCPTGQEQHEPGTVCLILDPGLAFGTGTHPTTALCLEWLAEHDLTGKRVIDYGCGSGILAVAAVLLGAREAHAIDIDPQALTATQDNAAKNGIADRVHGYLPEQFTSFAADVVLANILAQPLIELSANITALVAPEGTLVLSGILQEQAEAVGAAYRSSIELNPPVIREDWCRLDGRKIK